MPDAGESGDSPTKATTSHRAGATGPCCPLPPDQAGADCARQGERHRAGPLVGFGDVSPSARLPFTVAAGRGRLSPFSTARRLQSPMTAGTGYTKFEREGIEPRYAFGPRAFLYRFRLPRLEGRRIAANAWNCRSAMTNTGARAGRTRGAGVRASARRTGRTRPARLLKAFCRGWRSNRATIAIAIPHHPQIGAQPVRRGEPEWHLVKGRLPFFSVGRYPRRQSSCEGSRS